MRSGFDKSTNFAMMTCRSQRALKKAQQHRGERGVRLFIDALARGIVDPPDPIEAIKFRMEQLNVNGFSQPLQISSARPELSKDSQ